MFSEPTEKVKINILLYDECILCFCIIDFLMRAANASATSCYPTPFSSQVVEGEQVHRMRREREGLQRGKVQGAGLSICQGGELRHDVSGIPCGFVHDFVRGTYITARISFAHLKLSAVNT